MSKKRIVVVEDDMIIMELHKHYVENLGHEVVGAFTCGTDVLDFFRENTADLVLMDIRLENREDGIETVKSLQEITTVPVVYISGNTDDSNLERAVGTNFKGFLSKPLAVDDLNNIIESVTELSDSIWYAQRIQRSIIPDRSKWSKYFDHPVFINRPKDVITGDFCSLYKRSDNGDFIGAVGDCTGHGIPAALLSVLSYQVVYSASRRHTDVRKLLYHVNKGMLKALSNGASQVKIHDALELIVFHLDPSENKIYITGSKMQWVHYNAAKNTFQFHSMRGPTLGQTIPPPDQLPLQVIEYLKGDFFYFFSDGIKDQFGGFNNRKMMKKGLLALLQKIQRVPAERRNIEIEIALRKWQGSAVQTDDMLLLGFDPSTYQSKKISAVHHQVKSTNSHEEKSRMAEA